VKRPVENPPSYKKGKEMKSIYIAPFCTKVHTKRSGMDHTVLPANNTILAFLSWRSPDVTTTATEAADIQLQLTTHKPAVLDLAQIAVQPIQVRRILIRRNAAGD